MYVTAMTVVSFTRPGRGERHTPTWCLLNLANFISRGGSLVLSPSQQAEESALIRGTGNVIPARCGPRAGKP